MINKPVIKKCPKCHKLYKLGYNGVVGGCDDCMGQRRDREEKVWGKGQSTQTLIEVGTWREFTVRWEDVKP